MNRRSFLRAGGAITAAGLSARPLLSQIPPHNFDKYDFGAGPPISDRLYQGPFSADDYPSWNVVMGLTPSRQVVPNYGMGLITYVCDEVGPARKDGESLTESSEVRAAEGDEVAGVEAESGDRSERATVSGTGLAVRN